MFLEVSNAIYLGDYRLQLEFNNGVIKEVDLRNKLEGVIFEPLRDKSYFQTFFIKYNTIEWNNGADFAPEFLYEIGK